MLFSRAEPKWGLLEVLFTMIFTIASSSSIFGTCIYWPFLHEGQVSMSVVTRNGVNDLLLIGDLFLSRAPVRSDHITVR